MIIEFKVSNYRSIKDEVCLSMVANNGNEGLEYVEKYEGYEKPLLKSIALYGSNGSGKSNVLQAINALTHVVTYSKTGDEVDGSFFEEYEPFLFDEKKQNEATCFELDYLSAGKRYIFSLCLKKTHIVNEKLWMFKDGKKNRVYTRRYNEKRMKDEFDWGDFLTNEQKNAFKKVVEWAPGKTFLQVIGREEIKIFDFIRPAYEWFRRRWLITPGNFMKAGKKITIDLIEDNKGLALKDKIIDFIKQADISIADCRIEGKREKDVVFIYRVGDEDYELPFKEESLGTRRFFGMAGLMTLMKEADIKETLIFDEIETSLHPELVEGLLKSIKGQVIFTTHDNSIMNELRRDQIWFTEKNRETLSTELYSLAHFKGIRKDLDKRAAYKRGLLGAYPFIGFDVADEDRKYE